MNHVAIVIPTHNRHVLIPDLVSHYQNIGRQVYLLDSSTASYEGDIARNIVYIHLPGYPFARKILHLKNIINIKFVYLVADDDFLVADIDSAVLALSSSSCSVYTGSIAWFDNHSRHKSVRYTSLNNFAIYRPNGPARFLGNYKMILWSLYKYEDLLYIFDKIMLCDIKNDNFIEMIISYLGQERGGIYIDSCVTIYRHIELGDNSWGKRHTPLGMYEHFNSDVASLSKLLSLNSTFHFSDDASIYYENSQSSPPLLKSFIKMMLMGLKLQRLVFYLSYRRTQQW